MTPRITPSYWQRLRSYWRAFQGFRRAEAERLQWLSRHMALRSMEFSVASEYECFTTAQQIGKSWEERVWLYETILPRVGRAADRPGHPAPTLSDLLVLYK